MSFEGFIVDHWIPDSDQAIPLTMIHCKKCGAKAPRNSNYMRDVCTEIRCPTCGNHAVKSSEFKENSENARARRLEHEY